MFKPKIYLAVKMTGRHCDELLKESNQASKKLEQAGFIVLSPVIEEGVPNKHIKLLSTLGRLRTYWARDKEMLNEAHIMLDFNSQGTSDGVNVEMGYTRFCLWKPLVRVHPTLGCTISRIEYDHVAPTLDKAIEVMQREWGSKSQLRAWRFKMLARSLPKFVWQQIKFMWEVM